VNALGPRDRRERAWARVARVGFWAGLAFALLAPLAVHWVAGRTLVWFDTQRLYAPERWLADEALRALRLPLWNPYLGAGAPFLADAIHGVLHPVSVLTAWLGTEWSADVLIGGYVACAGLGAALLARELGASRTGAAVAAFAYGTSGYVLSMAGNLVFLAGAGSLPFLLAGARSFAREPRPASLLAAAAGAAALALSGDAQAAVVGGALALVLAWEAAGWRGAARALAGASVGVLLAGVQLAPAVAHLPRTLRSEATWTAAPEVWAFEPWRLLELVLPGFIWGPDPYADAVFASLAGPGHWPAAEFPMPFAASVVVGLLPMALALAGGGEGRRGKVLVAVALVLLWIALGPALGASAILGELPLWRAFRYAEKLVGPLTLVVAALAGLGADAAVEGRVGWRRLLAPAVGLGVVALAAATFEVSRLDPGAVALAAPRVVRGAWHVGLSALALAAWLALRGRLGRTGAGLALAALAWVGAAASSPAALHPGDPEARLRTPGPALEAPPPGPRISTPYYHDLTADDPSVEGPNQAARMHAALGYPAYNVRARLESLDTYTGAVPLRLGLVSLERWAHWPLGPRRYGVTHLVLDPPITASDRRMYTAVTSGATRIARGGGGQEIWEVPHRAWASFPDEVVTVVGEEVARAETAAALLRPHDTPTIVEAASPFRAAQGHVRAVERGLESLRIVAESADEATLVVADAWWPGWEATLDGHPATIFRADALVRAVRWPAGRHVLEMRYRPPEVRTGLVLSALGLAALVAGMAWLRRRPAPGPEATR
jgi:hypothetical protein